MNLIKILLKVLSLPVLIITGTMWLIIRTTVWGYEILHGIMGFIITAFILLSIGFREWTIAIAILGLGAVLFSILFLGVFVQEMLAHCSRSIWNFIISHQEKKQSLNTDNLSSKSESCRQI